MIDKKPALIARCSTTDDVVTCVEFGGEYDLLTSVRGGGHNVTGSAVCDGGVTIDHSLMKGSQVDPKGRLFRAD